MKKLASIFGKLSLFTALALCALPSGGAPTFTPNDQPLGDVPPLALTGFNLSTGTVRAFQVYFDGNSWAGDVSAFPVGTDGRTQLVNKIWSAAAVFATKQACGYPLTDPAGSDVNYFDSARIIVTRNGTTNIPFRWASLSPAQQASLDADPTKGGQILNFVRGDRSLEKYQQILAGDGITIQSQCGVVAPGTGLFRARASIFGDVIHARPVFIGPPPADYLFDSYPAFKSTNAGRAERVFVGSNDGMVHAFDAVSGDEAWAYVPSMLIGSLNSLTVDPYTHRYLIDGTMSAGDANFGNTASPDWRTVIVGGLGAGGKGLFALDATAASAADENEAKAKILWEITPQSSGFADLGYTYGSPIIARMNTGDWVAIVGNGYLNANTGHAVLYIIDLKTGALIKALDTGSGTLASPNGLSSPAAVDTSFDGKVDRIYAGDIDGNLWKFDVSAATAASWTAPASPLFPTSGDITAGIVRKPILGAPDVAAHPISGFLVYFATGRLLTAADAADATAQNFAYGIWDGAPAANTTVLNQTLTEKLIGTQRVRVSSSLPINWNDASNPVGNPLRKGWRTALPAGEQSFSTGFVRDARYQFMGVNATVTHTPPPDGENWLIELDYLTGGAADKPIFDINADRLLNDDDRVTGSGGAPQAGPTGVPVAVYISSGLLSEPVLANVSSQLSTTIFNDNPYYAPGTVPPVPPTSTDRGVAGGHFDIDIYYAPAGAKICEYDPPTSGSPGTNASVVLNFTYGGNKTADPLVIKLGGVNILTANNPGGKSANNLESWVSTHLTAAFLADWTVSTGGGKLTFTSKLVGTVWNGKLLEVTDGAGMDAGDYTGENTSTAGGTDSVPGVETFKKCQSQKHFHEYDDIFNVTGVNMLNASDPLLNMDKAIASTSTNFKVILHNQYLSPAVTLSIGGAPYVSVKNFTTSATLDLATLPTYTRASIGTFAFNMPTDAFAQKDWWGATPADIRVGLHPTQTSCVNKVSTATTEGMQLFKPVIPPANGVDGAGTNDWLSPPSSPPGDMPSGARHNGALVFQVIKNTTPNSAIEQNVPGRPEYGWRVRQADFETYVLAEWTTFWHYNFAGSTMVPPQADPPSKDRCYGDAGWLKAPVPDTGPTDPKKYKTPSAGSSDPGFGTARAIVVSTTTTTTTSGGTTTTVVTTNYSDGSRLIVTTVTMGGVSTTTSQYVPAGSGGTTGGSGSSVNQSVSSPNTITGYQQTRNSGKLGRVTWRELFAQ